MNKAELNSLSKETRIYDVLLPEDGTLPTEIDREPGEDGNKASITVQRSLLGNFET